LTAVASPLKPSVRLLLRWENHNASETAIHYSCPSVTDATSCTVAPKQPRTQY